MVGSSALSYPGRISAWARGTPRLTPLAMNAFSESPHRSDCEARLIVENMPGFAWSADQNGKLTYLNQRFLEYTGKRIEDFNGGAGAASFGPTDVLHPEDVADPLKALSHSVASGDAFVLEHRVRPLHAPSPGVSLPPPPRPDAQRPAPHAD